MTKMEEYYNKQEELKNEIKELQSLQFKAMQEELEERGLDGSCMFDSYDEKNCKGAICVEKQPYMFQDTTSLYHYTLRAYTKQGFLSKRRITFSENIEYIIKYYNVRGVTND